MAISNFDGELLRDPQSQPQSCTVNVQSCPAQLEVVLESIQDGLIALDGQWRLVCMNNAAVACLGGTRDGLIGGVLWEVFPQWRHSLLYDELMHAAEQRIFIEFEDYSLLTHWYEYRCYPTRSGMTVLFHDITDRKQTEEALQQSEKRYRLFVQNFQGIVYQGRMDFVPIFFHGAVEKITGYTEQEFTAGVPRWDQIIHPEDRAIISETGGLLSTTPGYATQREYRILRKDGQTRWVYEQIQNLCDDSGSPCLVQGAIYDITDHKRIEEELRQLNEHLDQQVSRRTAELTQTVERLYREVSRRILVEGYLRKRSQMIEAFFQHTITPMAFLNWCFDFVRVNEAYAKAAGKDPEYFVGRNYFTLHPDAQMQAVFERVVRTCRPYRAYATPFRREDDPQQATAYWNWQLTPLLDERGEAQFVVLNLQDVTEQQMTLQESQEHARRLQQLTLELSQAEDRERSRLAEILHDDLQQTLAAAKFHLALLSRRVAEDAELRELAAVTNSLLKQAIDTSRSLSHELSPPALSDNDLCETFKWLAGQMQSKHGLAVHLDVCQRTVVASEPLKAFLYKAVQEMLFNVIKHAYVSQARLRLRHRRGHIYLSVSDSGRGFDPGRLVKSDGFGLLSVRERVKLLGGRMKIRSAAGKGSIFLLAVPDSASERK